MYDTVVADKIILFRIATQAYSLCVYRFMCLPARWCHTSYSGRTQRPFKFLFSVTFVDTPTARQPNTGLLNTPRLNRINLEFVEANSNTMYSICMNLTSWNCNSLSCFVRNFLDWSVADILEHLAWDFEKQILHWIHILTFFYRKTINHCCYCNNNNNNNNIFLLKLDYKIQLAKQ